MVKLPGNVAQSLFTGTLDAVTAPGSEPPRIPDSPPAVDAPWCGNRSKISQCR